MTEKEVATAIVRPKQRLVITRQRKFSYSTAVAYIMAKQEMDNEWRQIVEGLLETLINREGIGGHPVDFLEFATDREDA